MNYCSFKDQAVFTAKSINIMKTFKEYFKESIERVKYPRTPHLPWSLGFTDDDINLKDVEHFINKHVIVTEKLDGENTTLTFDYTHARSLDSNNHPSRNWVKNFWSQIKSEIPNGMRIHGENMYAKHSIKYSELPTYFIVFGISEGSVFLSWKDTVEWCELLGLTIAPVLYNGVFDEEQIKKLFSGKSQMGGDQEGYVIRTADSFLIKDFQRNVAKFVRKNHVQADAHWTSLTIEPNILKV
jgi:hypothetical protein